MNPAAIIELAHKNKQNLILGDKFETVNGDSASFTKGIKEEVVEKDKHERIGKFETV